jgi:hypothetical protein
MFLGVHREHYNWYILSFEECEHPIPYFALLYIGPSYFEGTPIKLTYKTDSCCSQPIIYQIDKVHFKGHIQTSW